MKGKFILITFLISFNSFGQNEKNYPESFHNILQRPINYALDTVIIEGEKYVGEILRSQQFLTIDLGNGKQMTGSIGTPSNRRENYIISDNRSTRTVNYELNNKEIKYNWIEAYPIINRKSLKNGFPVIIDDGKNISALSSPDGKPYLMNTPMSVVNLFESIGYKYIGTEVRPTNSTPIVSKEVGNLAASIFLGFDINNYEENTIVYIFKKL